MNNDKETPSVRVEYDGNEDTAVVPMLVDGGSPRHSTRVVPIMIIIGVLGTALGLLSWLAPSEDQAADGTARGTTTSSPPTSATAAPTTLLSPASAETATAQVAQTAVVDLIPTTGFSEVEAIVRSGEKFLALQFEEAENAPPRLIRSTNGSEWTSVSTEVDHTSDTSGSVVLRDYDSLVSIESGFAVLMHSIHVQTDADSGPLIETVRLASTDGVRWQTDPEFEAQIGGLRSAFHHSPNAVASIDTVPSPRVLVDLLQPELRNEVDLKSVCSARAVNFSSIVIGLCDGSPAFTFSPDDIGDPALFEAVIRCAEQRAARSVLVLQAGQGSVVHPGVRDGSIGLFGLDDGSVAALYSFSDDFSWCTQLYGRSGRRPPALFRWLPGGTITVEPLPFEAAGELVSLSTPPVVVEDRVIFASKEAVWAFSFATSEWSRPLDMNVERKVTTEPNVMLSSDGQSVLTLSSTSIHVGSLDSGQWVVAQVDVVNGRSSIEFVDAELALITRASETFLVPLPLAAAAGSSTN